MVKEIKSHLLIKETGTRSRPYNPCKHRYNCGRQENVCPQCIHQSIYKWDQQYCANCDMACYKRCDDFEEELCRKLTKPPYVCNGCGNIRSCTLRKQTYDAKEAQAEYETVRRESRQGICIDADELKRIDDIITPLVKNGQSIHHIETSESRYFSKEELPQLAEEKCNAEQIQMCFEAYQSKAWTGVFD